MKLINAIITIAFILTLNLHAVFSQDVGIAINANYSLFDRSNSGNFSLGISGGLSKTIAVTDDFHITPGFQVSLNLYNNGIGTCLLYTSPSPRDATLSRMPSSA